MADEADVKTDETDESVAPAKSSKGLIIVFVGIVVLVETAMFFLLVPSAEDLSAMAQEKLIERVEEGETEAEKDASEEEKIVEVQFGRFSETFSPDKTEADYRVDLTGIYGLVRQKNVPQWETEWKEKQGRIRDAISRKIRNSTIEELKENQLGLLERRILTTCNHLLDDDILEGVGFDGYQLLPQ